MTRTIQIGKIPVDVTLKDVRNVNRSVHRRPRHPCRASLYAARGSRLQQACLDSPAAPVRRPS